MVYFKVYASVETVDNHENFTESNFITATRTCPVSCNRKQTNGHAYVPVWHRE
jgi:hypothetical protein